jgi:hypothetical protein
MCKPHVRSHGPWCGAGPAVYPARNMPAVIGYQVAAWLATISDITG